MHFIMLSWIATTPFTKWTVDMQPYKHTPLIKLVGDINFTIPV